MVKMIAIAVAGLVAGSAVAAPPLSEYLTRDMGDPYGAASIQQGRYDQAQKRLTGAYQRGDRSPELLLNLAALRGREGGDAQGLYREVLNQPNESLVTTSGTRWSHEIAQARLGR